MFGDSESVRDKPSFLPRVRYFTVSDTTEVQNEECDLDMISVLSAAQGVGTDLLPITWQQAQANVRSGGTARVNHRQLDRLMRYAFKCVKKEEKETKLKKHIFEQAINEVSILGSTSIREHPHIVNLEGVCWDVDPDNTVWPVLVFEHAPFGDLHEFAKSSDGLELHMGDRVRICVDIATAVCDMHARGVIHGDLKPSNILVFQTNTNALIARVTDFGYSRTFASADDRYILATSRPWSAPEHARTQRRFSKDAARKTDCYSLGMVIVWFLFRDVFCGNEDFPGISMSAQEHLHSGSGLDHSGPSSSTDPESDLPLEFRALESLKHSQTLLQLSCQLARSNGSLTEDQKPIIMELSRRILQHHPDERHTQIDDLLDTLQHDRYRQSLAGDSGISAEPAHPEFQISHSVGQLYRADFRLRRHLVSCLQNRLRETSLRPAVGSTHRNTQQQLLLCITVGFGDAKPDFIPLDKRKSNDDLQHEVDNTLKRWAMIRPKPFTQSITRAQVEKGSFLRLDSGDFYQSQGCLDEAIESIQQEAVGLHKKLGTSTIMSYTLETALASLFRAVPSLEIAEKWARRAYSTSRSIYDDADSDRLTTMGNLGVILTSRRNFEEAEELFKLEAELEAKHFGDDDIDLLGTKQNLGAVYREQKKLELARAIQESVVRKRREVQGSQHEDYLTALADLASTFTLQGQFNKAESREVYVWNTRRIYLGDNHPDTPKAGNNLFVTYMYQEKWSDAVELGHQVLEMKKKYFGKDKLSTLQTMSNLSQACSHVGRLGEALELASEVRKERIANLGESAEDSITALACEGNILFRQAEFEKAKLSYETALRNMKSDHPLKQSIEKNHRELLKE